MSTVDKGTGKGDSNNNGQDGKVFDALNQRLEEVDLIKGLESFFNPAIFRQFFVENQEKSYISISDSNQEEILVEKIRDLIEAGVNIEDAFEIPASGKSKKNNEPDFFEDQKRYVQNILERAGADEESVNNIIEDLFRSGRGNREGEESEYESLEEDKSLANSRPDTDNIDIRIDEDGSYIFSVDDFSFRDDSDANLKSIKITSVPINGRLLFNNKEISEVIEVSEKDLLSGRLKYEPESNGFGEGYSVFNFQVGDGELFSENYQIVFNVNPVNDAPIINAGEAIDVQEEGISVGDTVALFLASDFDPDDTITFSLTSGNDQGYFAIDGSTGVVTLTQVGVDAINSDVGIDLTNLNLGVTASDGVLNSSESIVNIDITRINDNAPVMDTASGSTITEGSINTNTVVASFTASDLDDADTVTFSLTSGNDQGYFAIDGSTGVVTLTQAGVNAINSDAGIDINSLSLGVTASDGTRISSESTVSVDITRINDNAPVMDTAAGSTITEGSINTSTVVASFTASDLDDADTVTFSLTSGNDQGYFAIDSSTGVVTLTQAGVDAINSDAGVDINSLSLGVTASDGTRTSSESTVTVDITRINDNAPVMDTASGSTITEGSINTNTVVASFTASDLDDADTVTFSLTSGNDQGYFAIDSSTGVVTLTQAGVNAINSDAGIDINSLSLGVTASDGTRISSESTVSVDITRINDNAPVMDTAAGSTITEGSINTNTVVASFTASDLDDADIVTFSLTSGNDQGYFAIDGSTGVVTLTQAGVAAINSDAGIDINSLSLGVTASDGTRTSSESTVSVDITRINDNAPVMDTASGSTITEGSINTSTVVASFTASDLDDADTVTFSLTSGNDQGYFAIDSSTGVVTLTQAGVDAINSDAGVDINSLSLGVTASDGTRTSSESTVTVDITRINDNAPVMDTASGSTITEGSINTNTVVASFTASDLDDADTVTFSLTSGNDQGYFAIDGSTGVVTLTQAGVAAINSDAGIDINSLSLGVTASDGTRTSSESTVSVDITRINDNAPVMDTASGSTITEGAINISTVVASFTASDLDDADIVTFSLTSGNDQGYFAIDSSTGVVTLTQAGVDAINSDAGIDTNSLSLGVTASDGTRTSSESTVSVDITRINDNAPVMDTASGSTITEGAINISTVVASFTASDLDDADTVTFSLTSGNDQGYFAIDSSTGVVTLTQAGVDAINSDVGVDINSLSLGVTASDGTRTSSESTVTVDITRINDNAPVMDTASGSTITEGSINTNTVVASFTASDLDDADTVTFSLTSGNDQGYFAIDGSTGVVTLTQAGVNAINSDAGIDINSLSLGVTASDGTRISSESTVSVDITRINDNAPVMDTAAGSTITEGSINTNTVVASFTASDLDDADTVTFSLTGGNDQGYFAIDSSTGVVTLTQAGVNAINSDAGVDINSLSLGVTASDGTRTSSESTVTVDITRINDNAPVMDTASGSTITEGSINTNTVVASFTASDLDDADTVTFSLTSGNDQGYFAIDSSTGVVTLTQAGVAAINSDAGIDINSLSLGVTASDGTRTSSESTVSVDITRINDNAPVMDTASGSTITEGSINTNTVVASFTASDLDDADTVTFSLTSGNDQGYFAIDSSTGVVRLTQAGVNAINSDAGVDINSLSLGVTASDGTRTSSESTVSVDITRINDNAPVMDTASGSTITEGSINTSTVVASFTASDLDDADTVTFSLTSGNDQGYFAIDSSTGVVTLTQAGVDAINSDAGVDINSLSLGVTASDGTRTSSESTVTVDITRINDNAPVMDTASGSTITEGSINTNTVVASFTASDLDDADTVTFSLTSGNDQGYFAIDSSTGVVTLTQAGVAAINSDAGIDINSLSLGVTASDGTRTSSESTVSVDITRINDNAPVMDTASGSTITEGAINISTVVASFTASDLDDADIVTFSLTSGNDQGYFAIDGSTGVVTLTQAGVDAINSDAGIDINSLSLGVTASDGTRTSSESTVTVEITRINDNAPVMDTAAGSTLTEGAINTSTVVASFTASDLDDADTVTFSLTSGNDQGYFAIDGSTGVVTLTQAGVDAINSDAGIDINSLSLGVTASDGTRTSSESTVTVNITRINDNAPVMDTAAGSTLTEGAINTNTVVASFTASDLDDADTVTFSLTSGNDQGYFAIDGSTGVVTLTQAGVAAINSDADIDINSLSLGVTASDGTRTSSESTVSVDITRINDNAPVMDTASGSTITEGSINTSTVVASFTASDLDDADTVTFSLTSGNDQGYFAIDSSTGVVTLTQAGVAAINSDAGIDINSLSLGVTASDGTRTSSESTVSVDITRINDNAPVMDTASGSTITEGSINTNTVVASFTASDLDDADTVTFSLTSGNDQGYFAIDSSTGVVTLTQAGVAAINSDAGIDINSLSLGVTASDGTRTSSESTVSVDITRINDNAPVMDTASGSTITEGAINISTVVASFTASDLDDADIVTFSLTSGNDQGYFAIDGSTGVVTLTQAGVAAINSDAGIDINSLSLGVTASDGTRTSSESTVSVDITRINDNAPVMDTASGSTITEGSINTNTVVASFTASDLDDVDTVTFSLTSGNDEGYFAIDSSTGVVTLTQAGVEAINSDAGVDLTSLSLGVTASDGTYNSSESTVTVDITRINDNAPLVTGVVSYNILEDNSLLITEDQLLANASDVDGDNLSVQNLTSSSGSITDNGNGTWTLTPTANFSGNVQLNYDVSDGTFSTAAQGSVSVTAVVDSASLSVNASTTDQLPDGAVFQLRADSLGNITDGDSVTSWDSLTGNHDASVVGTAPRFDASAGSGSGGIDFSGRNGVLQIPDHADININGTSARSFAFSFATGANTDGFQVIYEEGGGANGYSLSIVDGKLYAFAWSETNWPNGNQHKAILLGEVSENTSYEVVMVHDGDAGTFSGWLDGELIGTLNGANAMSAHSGDIGIGGIKNHTVRPDNFADNTSETGGFFEGAVHELTMWNDALSADQVDAVQGRMVDSWRGVISEDTPVALDISAALVDTGGSEVLSITIDNLPAGASLSAGTDNGNGSWTLTPDQLQDLVLNLPENFNGQVQLSVTATSTESATGETATTTENITIDIAAVNDLATTSDNSVNGVEDTSYIFTLNDFPFSDVDTGDSLQAVQVVSLPGQGQLLLDSNGDGSFETVIEAGNSVSATNISNGRLSFQPEADFNGTLNFDFKVNDGSDWSSNTGTMTINIAAESDEAVISGNNQGAVTEDLQLTTSGSLSITDADAGEASFIPETLNGTYGTLTINTAGEWNYNITNSQDAVQSLGQGDSLTDTITIRSLDGTEHDISITINGANDAAVIGGVDTGNLVEDASSILVANGTLAIDDTDSGENSFNAGTVTGNYGSLTINQDGSWSYSAQSNQSDIQNLGVNQSLTENLIVRAVDGTEHTITVTINGSNDAPTVSASPSFNGTEDIALIISESDLLATASDIDGDNLSVRGLSAESGNLTDNGNGTWTYTPADNNSGNVILNYEVFDGVVATSATANVDIEAIADTPNLSVGSDINIFTTDFSQLTTDFPTISAFESITGWSSNNSSGVVESFGESSYGGSTSERVLELEAYSGDNNIFRDIATGPGKVYEFSFDFSARQGVTNSNIDVYWGGEKIADLDGSSGQFSWNSHSLQLIGDGTIKRLEFRSEDSNGAGGLLKDLELVQKTHVGIEDQPIDLEINAFLADNDGSETLALAITNIPHGTVLSDGTNTFTSATNQELVNISNWNLNTLQLTPPLNHTGELQVTVNATASESTNVANAVSSEVVTFNVMPVQDAPIIAEQLEDVSTAEEAVFSYTLPAGAFSDPDGDTLTLSATLSNGNPLPGWLSFDPATQTFSGTPDDPDLGTVTVKVTASDGTDSVDALFGLTVTATDDAPVAGNIDLGATTEDTSFVITSAALLANASDVDGDTLSVDSVSLANASQGAVVNNGNGTWTFTPTANLSADDVTFNFSVTDGTSGDEASATATLDVTAVVDAPELSSDQVRTETSLFSTSGAGGWSDNGGTHWNTSSGESMNVGSSIIRTIDTSSQGATYEFTMSFYGDFRVEWNGQTIATVSQLGYSKTSRTISLPSVGNDTNSAELVVTAINRQGSFGSSNLQMTPGPVQAEEDTAVDIDLSIALTDTDGSETLQVSLAGVPDGATITDGTNSVIASGGTIDISGWNFSSVSFTPPENQFGRYELEFTATSSENGMQSSKTMSIEIDVASVNDSPESADNALLLATGNSYTFSADNFAFSDVDAGNSLQSITITSLPEYGSLTLNGSAVTANQVILASDIDDLVYTSPSSTQGAGTEFKFTVSDGAASSTEQSFSLNVQSPAMGDFSDNLLTNASAQSGTTGWNIISNGGDGWATVGSSHDGDGAGWRTSYGWTKKSQTIDLLAKGFDAEYLDTAPTINISDWFKQYHSGGDKYYLKVQIQDENQNVLASYDTGTLNASTSWQEASNSFENYGEGARYIYFEHGGDDGEYWAGQWGTDIDDSEVVIELEANTDFNGTESGEIILGTARKDTITAGGGDDVINGGAGDDIIIGGLGNDELTGGAGSDHFIWYVGDQGSSSDPTVDTITDFTVGQGGDVLDIKDLLIDESSDSIDQYLDLSFSDGNTEIAVKPTGEGSTSQTIVLENVDLSALGNNSSEILDQLISNGNLNIDN